MEVTLRTFDSPQSRRGAHAADFAALLGAQAWGRLPVAVRQRFAPHTQRARETTTYRGVMNVRASLLGRCLAFACLLLGTPVTPFVQDAVPVIVHVSDRPDGSGTVWERIYHFDGRVPVVVTSVKQMQDGELVEALGAGLRMRLQVFESRGALHFLSTGYYFQVGRIRIPVPGWLSPGTTHVIHEDQGDGRFRFTMRTAHAGRGALYDQSGVFS
jgi:Domain of unknown function (DUF4166)